MVYKKKPNIFTAIKPYILLIKKNIMKKILIPYKNGKKIFYEKDVIYCEANGKYSRFHIDGFGEIMICKCLKELEPKLSGNNFCRIHRKFLVNINFLKDFTVNGKCVVILEGNIKLPVSIREKTKVKRFIEEYFK